MEKENARKQRLEQLHERRKQVVRLHKKGIKIMQIVAMTDLSYPAVRATIDRFAEGGWSAIRPTARGRSRGDGRCLSAEQEEAIRRTIIDRRPGQLKMDFFLWSRAAIGQLNEFLAALIKDVGRKVFLILDNLRVHHSKLVKAWVAERPDQIALFYLPSYSPQLNPEARLNADFKEEMGDGFPSVPKQDYVPLPARS